MLTKYPDSRIKKSWPARYGTSGKGERQMVIGRNTTAHQDGELTHSVLCPSVGGENSGSPRGRGIQIPRFLTVEQTAEILQLSSDTVYNLLASGEIPGRKFGKCWRISLADVIDNPKTLQDQATSRAG